MNPLWILIIFSAAPANEPWLPWLEPLHTLGDCQRMAAHFLVQGLTYRCDPMPSAAARPGYAQVPKEAKEAAEKEVLAARKPRVVKQFGDIVEDKDGKLKFIGFTFDCHWMELSECLDTAAVQISVRIELEPGLLSFQPLTILPPAIKPPCKIFEDGICVDDADKWITSLPENIHER